ncbi:MAG: hypothetical protein EOO30_20795 [Comamonadaceae bacterium]|nr:MAG: hypothetical protein EOO30_20795 [Comamonadaceae bacterium]
MNVQAMLWVWAGVAVLSLGAAAAIVIAEMRLDHEGLANEDARQLSWSFGTSTAQTTAGQDASGEHWVP